jgi:hypothetical protein
MEHFAVHTIAKQQSHFIIRHFAGLLANQRQLGNEFLDPHNRMLLEQRGIALKIFDDNHILGREG